MNNDIMPGAPYLPVNTTTTIQEQKVNNFDIKDSNVTFNVTMSSPYLTNNPNEIMLVLSRFSREYYQLIVTAEDIFDEDNSTPCPFVTMTSDRALSEHNVPAEIYERCSSLSYSGIEELKEIPAIICTEKKGSYYATVDKNHMAVYGYIRKIKKNRKLIKIYYKPLAMVPLHCFCENPVDYDVNVGCALSDFNISAWSVHKINLFEAFRDTGILNVPVPM